MATNTLGWREHALHVLFVIAMALASIAWNGHDERLKKIEEHGSPAFQIEARGTRAELEGLRRDVQRLEMKVDNVTELLRRELVDRGGAR